MRPPLPPPKKKISSARIGLPKGPGPRRARTEGQAKGHRQPNRWRMAPNDADDATSSALQGVRVSFPGLPSYATTIPTIPISSSTMMQLHYDVLLVLLVSAPVTLLVAACICLLLLLLLSLAFAYKDGKAGPCRWASSQSGNALGLLLQAMALASPWGLHHWTSISPRGPRPHDKLSRNWHAVLVLKRILLQRRDSGV